MKKILRPNKTRILIPLLLLSLTLLFCLTTVSAAPGDAIYVNGSSGNDSWDGLSATHTDGTLIGPKLSIKNATKTVNTGGRIHIANGQYTGENNTNITIDKNMSIIGESQRKTIINGTGTNWIFHINPKVNITITNLTLTNAKLSNGIGSGGAIDNGGNLTVTNCTFTNNTVTNAGGAIVNRGTINSLSDCTFTGNKAINAGGAIYNYEYGTITSLSGCTFTNNNAINAGGAIYNDGGTITSLSDCTFTNNNATNDGGGGAICNFGTITSLSGCTFTNNNATYGGAIYNDYYGTISNLSGCTFTKNTANKGGAIRNHGSCTVHFSSFTNNTATSGNAICCDGGSMNATLNWWGSNIDPMTISNLIVVESGSVNASTWVILTVNANPTIINNTQTTIITADLNHYTNSTGYIGELSTHIPDGINVTYSSTLGSVSSGSEITNNGQTQTTFTPSCYSGLATVHTTVDDFSLDTPITITNSNIYVSNNTGSDTTGDGSPTKPYQTIKKGISSLTTGGTIHIANGQYTGQNNTKITINKNMNIIGEIQTGTIINAQHSTNIFTINSGVTVTIKNLTLTNGTATSDISGYGYGGAIYNYGTITLSDCTFTNNTVTSSYGYGGAIYNYGTITSLNGCTFNNNTAKYGGAIRNFGTITSLSGCNFTNNNATEGGAIRNYGTITSLSGCNFTNNNATDYGGAIYNHDGGTITSLSGCNFTNNNANKGGAICCYGGNLTANYNRFYNNIATNGNAIGTSSGSVNADYNWWGSNNPTWSTLIYGFTNPSYWVILTLNANPTTINNTQTSTVTADLNHYTNSIGNIGTLTGHIPDVDVIFAVDANGNLDSLNGIISNGQNAATTFTATKIGLATVSATVDGFTVNQLITILNNAPIVSNSSVTTDEDTSATGKITAADADGDTLTYTKATNPAHGTVTVNSDGTWTYTPNSDWYGTDSFTVTVNDGNGGSTTATVTITVNPVNDAPTAVNDSVTTNEDCSVDIDVLSNDTDVDTGDSKTINSFTQPDNGTTSLVGGKIRYTPNPNWYGTDTFTYTIRDGSGAISNIATVTITVNPVNDAPTVGNYSSTTQEDTPTSGTVVGSDVDNSLTYSLGNQASHGTAVVNPDGSWTYTPNANYNGPDSFTVIVSDGILTATSTITITINPVNDIPVANNDSKIIDEDNTATGQITATDADGDTLTYTKDTNPAHGTVTVNSNGTYSYTPNNNWHGTDSFTVLVSDSNGGTAVSTVTITVNSVNDIPVAQDDTATTKEGKSTNINVLNNDSDADSDSLTVINVTQPNHGTAVINADGTITYTPNSNWYGLDSFTYTISDGNGGTTTATVTITVNQAVSDLYIKTTSSSQNPTVGETFILTYKLGNNGPDAAENVTITFQIPEGLDFINISVDNGKCTYNETTRTVTWILDSVPVGDPYLHLTVKAADDGTYKITPNVTSDTYNSNIGDDGIISINIQANNSNSSNGTDTNTVKAASKTTIGLQKTGLPLNYLILAVLMVLCGLVPKRKY